MNETFNIEDKPESWSLERWNLFLKQRQAAIDAQADRENNFVPPVKPSKTK